MATRKTFDSSFEESPLLTGKTAPNSTINPGKLDQTRFTEIRENESEGSPVRIIIYVIIVIIIGVGAALLVKNLISNQQQSTDTSNSSSSQSVAQTSAFMLNKTSADDSTAIDPSASLNADYVDSALVNLGDSKADTTGIALNKASFTKFNTFNRLNFMFTTSDNKLPSTTINFDSVNNKMTLTFNSLQTIASDIKQNVNIGDIIQTVAYNQSTNNFLINFSDKVKYKVTLNGSNLNIDFKTITQLSKPDATTIQAQSSSSTSITAVSSSSSSSSIDTTKPAAPHYNNDLSQSKQYISSTLNTNSFGINTYFFDTLGGSYEFSWAQKNSIGDASTPNVTAYYDTSVADKTYLYVVIQNVSQEVFSSNGITGLTPADIQAKTKVNASNMNFNRIDLVSFTNGTATYRMELQRKTNFKLWMDKTPDNLTGTVSITINNN